MPYLDPNTIMPSVGTLWLWLGNQYHVIGTFGTSSITLREIGSGEVFYQCILPIDGVIAPPSK